MPSIQTQSRQLRLAIRWTTILVACATLLATFPLAHPLQAAPPAPRGAGSRQGALRLAFEPNQGQFADETLRFRVQAPGITTFFAGGGLIMALDGSKRNAQQHTAPPVVQVTFPGADASSLPRSRGTAVGRTNYFIGDDPAAWHAGIPTFPAITYASLWPGVDLTFDGASGLLKSTYTVAPAADPGMVRWCYAGVQGVALDAASGALRVAVTATEELRELAPQAWQETAAGRQAVAVAYQVSGRAGDNCVGFQLGRYDRTRPLVIDPTLVYSSYLGGSLRDVATDVALGPDGAIYLTGATYSPDFPLAGTVDPARGGTIDAFVAKLSPDGATLLFSTYLGGSSNENLFAEGALAVDEGGDVYVTGESSSGDFPRVSPLGGVVATGANSDIFVAKLSGGGGSMLYSSLIGSGGRDLGTGIAVDDGGNAYVTGAASGGTFPLVSPLYEYNGGDAILFKVSPSGNQLLFSTYFGTSMSNEHANDIALDAFGAIYIIGETLGADLPTVAPFQASKNGAGWDAFVARFSGDGRALLYASYFGGSGDDSGDSIAVDGLGQMVITGGTSSTDLPAASAADGGLSGQSDAFVAKFGAGGSTLVFSTYLGGSEDENLFKQLRAGLAMDEEGSVYASGFTYSRDFPSVEQLPGQVINNNASAYLTKFGPGGNLVYSTLYGGPDQETSVNVAVDSAGTAVIAGETRSTALPLVQPLQARSGGGVSDAFVARIAHGPGATVQISPARLTFATQAVNETSAPQSFLITALAAGGLPISGMVLEGPHAGDFAIAEYDCPLGGAVPPQGSCRVVVTFRPSASGLRTARIVIASPSWSGPRVVTLLGYGKPAVSLDPALIQFLAQKPATASLPQRITLTNIGSEPLTLGTTELVGADAAVFSPVADSCSGQTLAAGATCSVDVRFLPPQLGSYFAEVRFNSPVFNEQPTVALQGTGAVPPALALTHKFKQPGAVEESPLCTCTGRILVATGANFPPGAPVKLDATAATGAIFPVANLTADGSGNFAADVTMPEIAGGGLVTVTAAAEGQPGASVVVRTPRTDRLPIILIPGVSASTLVATDHFLYTAPPDPALLEFGFAWATANPLVPEIHTVLKGHTPWLDLWAVGRLLLGHYRYLDMLKLKADGLTPETDLLGVTPQIGVGSILWGVAGQDFFDSFRTMLLNRGYTEGQTLFYFPYDWRKNLTPTADDLQRLIKEAKQASGKDQVVIVAHSMGGLVARNYIVRYGAADVDQVISIGTPYLGAPMVAKVLEAGDSWGLALKLFGIGAGMHPNEMRKLAQNFGAAYQLSPAKGWFDVGVPYIVRSRMVSGSVVREPLDYTATQRFMSARHNATLVAQAEQFHKRRIGDLSYLTNQYYAQRIVGIGEPTPGRIEFTTREVCGDTFFGVVCVPLIEVPFPKLDFLGDNTVPYPSALGNNARDGRVYALPGTHHPTQPGHPQVQALVQLILEGKLCDNNQIKSLNPLELRPAAGAEGAAIELVAESAQEQQVATNASGLEVIVYGAGDLSIVDAQGRLTGRDRAAGPYAARLEIPGSGYDIVNGLQIAMLPAGQTYEIRLSGIVTGAAQLQLSTIVDGVVTERVLYEGIATLPSTAAAVQVTAGGLQAPPPLRYSYDGAATPVDVQPLPTLTGAALDDLTPPTVSLAADASRMVTIAAEDNPGGTGVHRIYYETDASPGQTFAYSGPFAIPNGASAIRAFAVDKAGNSTAPFAELAMEVRTSLWLPNIAR